MLDVLFPLSGLLGALLIVALMLRAIGSPVVAWLALPSIALLLATQSGPLTGVVAFAMTSAVYLATARYPRPAALCALALSVIAIASWIVSFVVNPQQSDACLLLLPCGTVWTTSYTTIVDIGEPGPIDRWYIPQSEPSLLAIAVYCAGLVTGLLRRSRIASRDFQVSMVIMTLLCCVAVYVGIAYSTNPPNAVHVWLRSQGLHIIGASMFAPFLLIVAFFLGQQLGSTASIGARRDDPDVVTKAVA